MKIKLPAEIICRKFVIRELIRFFLEKRMETMGDDNFTFNSGEFNEYLRKLEGNRATTSAKDLKKMLRELKSFLKRDSDLKEIVPRTELLNYKITKTKITIKNCTTNDLTNTLRFIEISIFLRERPEDYKNESLFKITQDGKLRFVDRISENSLGLKERAIFLHLRKNFEKECDYKELFKKANEIQGASGKKLDNKYKTAHNKKEYINNGIAELRKKLYKLSGNPNTIKTIKGRISEYKLIY